MQTLLAVALVSNFLVEALAAASLIGGPHGLGAHGAPPAERWSMHYGFAVIAIASAGAWLWPRRRELSALTPVLGMLATFHVSVLVSLLLAADQPLGVVLHSVLGLLFVVSFALRRRIALA
jgi:hypothetical protein